MPSFIAEESLNSVRVFWLEQEKLIEAINEAARRVGEEYNNVVKIVLFGSLAEKKGTPGSDADILIILKEDDQPFLDRINEWHEKFAFDFPIEVFPYTEKEQDNPIVIEAMRRGITLFKR